MPFSREAESRKSAKMHTKDGDRVLVWHTSKEPGRISLAVPGDRATLTREEALEVASELTNAAQGMPTTPAEQVSAAFENASPTYQTRSYGRR